MILSVPCPPGFRGHTDRRHPVTIHRCSSVPGRELFSKGEDLHAAVPSLIRDSFSQLWKCHLLRFKEKTKKFADTLPSGHTHQLACFPIADTAFHGLAFSPPLTLLLADEKLNSPPFITFKGWKDTLPD